jgi:hypothetical protein
MAGPVDDGAFVTVIREPVVVMKSDTPVVITADASTLATNVYLPPWLP